MRCWQVGIDIFLPNLYAFTPILVNIEIILHCELNGNKRQALVEKHVLVLYQPTDV